jgi:hypothetical protein
MPSGPRRSRRRDVNFTPERVRSDLEAAGVEISAEERDDVERETRFYASRGQYRVMVAVSDDGYVAMSFEGGTRSPIRSIGTFAQRVAHFLATGEET